MNKPSIIVRHLPDQPQHDATDCFDIVIGDGVFRVAIAAKDDGWIELRAFDTNVEVRPVASNTLLVRAVPLA